MNISVYRVYRVRLLLLVTFRLLNITCKLSNKLSPNHNSILAFQTSVLKIVFNSILPSHVEAFHYLEVAKHALNITGVELQVNTHEHNIRIDPRVERLKVLTIFHLFKESINEREPLSLLIISCSW